MRMRKKAAVMLLLSLYGLISCGRIPSSTEPAFEVWHIASPGEGDIFVLDSSSLRPVVSRGELIALDRIVRFSNFQGGRFHPEAVRAIAEDPQVLDGFSRTLLRSVPPGATLLIDMQDMSPGDIGKLSDLVRTLSTLSKTLVQSRSAIIVPATDTVAYPTAVLSRVIDLLLVRLWDEFGPGTRPGPPATSDFIRRKLGARSTAIGASHVAAYFPLYGYIWNRADSADPISFEEANRLVIREAGAFRRDPSSKFLTATLRDGSTIWVPDAVTVDLLVRSARTRGATIIALSNFRGADPSILKEYPVRR